MAYSTPAMVRMALVSTPDGRQPNPASNTAADMTDTQLQDHIAEADSLIDARIGKYYAVPAALDPQTQKGPHPLDYWSRNIAAYLATLTYRGSMDFTDSDPILRRYKDTLAALDSVGEGRVKLQLDDNASTHSATQAGDPVNPYVGDLFSLSDFHIVPGDDTRTDWRNYPYYRRPWG